MTGDLVLPLRHPSKTAMHVVILDPDLDELLHTKKNKRYRKVERSKKLWEGLEKDDSAHGVCEEYRQAA